MGRKGKWFGAVKKVFSPESKEKKSKEKKLQNNSNKLGGIGKYKDSSDPSSSESFEENVPKSTPPPPPPPNIQPETNGVTNLASEATVHAASQIAVEVVPPKIPAWFVGKSTEEIAAIKIQTAFRGYLARRALRALKGLVRLKSMIHGNACKRQATTTLRCMQTLARVQSQIRSRRIRMSEENQALQRQLLMKREKELENLRMGDEWDDSLQSKEQIEASLLSRQEAAIRRERALAYAFTHQGKNSSRSANPMFMDPNNPQWGWSWLERWMSSRPWESRSSTDRDLNSDRASVKSAAPIVTSVAGDITKSYARRDNTHKPLRLSPYTPQSKLPTAGSKMMSSSASPKMGWAPPLDDDSRSMMSIKSERPNRRHSIAGSSVRDDDSLTSSPAVPSYMAPTKSARARSRLQSTCNGNDVVIIEGLDKVSAGSSAKKKLSFPAGPRRHSGPPKIDVASVTESVK